MSHLLRSLCFFAGLMLLASPAPASSQCDEACGIFNDPDTGEEIAWACVNATQPTGQTGCEAWAEGGTGGCSSEDCEPTFALATDPDGRPVSTMIACGSSDAIALSPHQTVTLLLIGSRFPVLAVGL